VIRYFLRFDQKTLTTPLSLKLRQIERIRIDGLEVATLNGLIFAGGEAVCIKRALTAPVKPQAGAGAQRRRGRDG
jgi:hypothetical protein